MIIRESSRVERIAYLTHLLTTSREINTGEVAQIADVSERTIQRDLVEISRVLPIYYVSGFWYYLDQTDIISPF
jgi:DeoR/GlpR family transcriptional regulator of sugar metabolism